MRYFSVGRPTKLVRDGRAEAYDEPPADWSAVTGTGGGPAAVADGQQPADTRTEFPAVALSGATMQATSLPGRSDPTAPTGVLPVLAEAGAAAHGAYARRRGRRMEYAFVAAGAVVAVLVFVALGGGARKPAIAPAAFVTKAAQRTLAQSTADVTLTGSVKVAGVSLALGGSGQVDFATGAVSLNEGVSLPNGSMTESVIQVGGNLYLNVSENGQGIAAVTGGRHWVKVPIPQSGSSNLTNGSPASELLLLSRAGAKVTSLGSLSIGGRSCNGYAATPTRQAMIAAATKEFKLLGLSAADTDAALQVLQAVRPPTIRIWFDPSRQLACQMIVNQRFGSPTSSSSTVGQTVETFTQYGVSVHITAPAASDTVSLQQLLKLVHH